MSLKKIHKLKENDLADLENTEETRIHPDVVGKKVDNATENLTHELSKLSGELQDLPDKLDKSFELIINKQTNAVKDLTDSYDILNSLRKTTLILVGVVAGVQIVSDVLTLKFISPNKIFIFGNVIVFIPYIFLTYSFFTNSKWKIFRENTKRVKESFQELSNLYSRIFGSELKNNVFTIFSEFAGKVKAGFKSVVEASITFSSLGHLYRESIEYFNDLQTFKQSLGRMLSKYNLELPVSLTSYIQHFDGDHLPRLSWIDRIAEQTKGLLTINPLIFKLFYLEAVNRNEENSNLLTHIKEDGSIVSLVNYLFSSEVVAIKYEYPNEWITKAMIDIIYEMESFSLTKFKIKLDNFMYLLQSYLNRISHVIEVLEINYSDYISRDFNPKIIANFESEYLDFLSLRVGINNSTMNLLYYSTWNEEETKKWFKEILRNEDLLFDLSRFLLSHNFKNLNLSEGNLSRIIASMDEFNLIELTRRGKSLEKVIAFENRYLEYLKNNNFPFKLNRLQIDDKLVKIGFGTEDTVLDKYIELSLQMIVLPDKIHEKNIFHTILLVIFFNETSAPDAKAVNKEVIERKDALLALYKFINISQESSPENRLSVISDAVELRDSNDEKDPIYSEFVFRLLHGQFVRYLPSLMSPMMKEIITDYRKIQSQGSYSKINLILEKIFKKRVGREQIVKMLSGNLIESYLVTVPSRGSDTAPVITLISDSDELIEAESDLAILEGDKSFNNLIKVRSAGTYTRIGILPEGMIFSDFSIKFEKVVRSALKKKGYNDYPVYLTKVSASSQMTSVIMDSPGNEISPFIAIRNLAEEVLPKEKLAALYAITNLRRSGKIGISDLVADIIDSDYGGIINVIAHIPEESILSRDDLQADEMKRKINTDLCERFSARSTSELCIKISSQILMLGKPSLLKLIVETLSLSAPKTGLRYKDIENTAKEIVDSAISISSIL